MIRLQTWAIFGLFMVGCAVEQRDKPPPPDPDGKGTPIGDACTNLRRLGCIEGTPNVGRTCFENLSRRAAILPVPAPCLRDAMSIDAARACGSPQTLRVRCVPDGG